MNEQFQTHEDYSSEKLNSMIVATIREALLVLDADLRVHSANVAFFKLFQVSEAETLGQYVYQLGNGQWNTPDLRQHLETFLTRQNAIQDYRVEHDFEQIGHRVMLLNAQRLNQSNFILLAFADITIQEETENALRQSVEKYQSLFSSIDEGFCIIEMLFDDQGKPVDYCFIEVNPAFENQTGIQDAEGRWMRDLIPDHEEYWFEIYGQVALTGESTRFERPAGQLGRYYDVYAFRIGQPEEKKVAILFKDILSQKQAEEILEWQVQRRTAQVQALTLELTLAEQKERERIAQMLHDDLQQQLFGIKLKAGLLANITNDAGLQQELLQIETELGNAILSTRKLSAELSSPVLHKEDLTEAIDWLCHEFGVRYNLQIEMEKQAAFLIPDEKQRVLVFQVIREILFNIVKHAQASRVSIQLQQLDDAYRIDIRDTGIGFDSSQVLDVTPVTAGRGLIIARNRLQLIGGSMVIESAPGAGTHTTIHIPIETSLSQSEQE